MRRAGHQHAKEVLGENCNWKVKVKVKFTLEQATKAQRGSRGIALSLTSALTGVGGERHAPAALPRQRPGTHCVGGWVGPRAGLDGCEKSRPTGIRSPDSSARSESLYRLSSPGPRCNWKREWKKSTWQ
jgi:hypothetical protein